MAVRKLYKITRELKKDETYAPQGLAIIEAIKANGEPIERGALLETLDKSKVLNSQQPTGRVFSFFRQQLLKSNLLKEITEKVENPNKPAKAASSTKKAGAKPKAVAVAKTAKGKRVA